ncbi:MAG: hypothetical protein O2894_02235, partial [Planctomycetota bacterium]|nr:hypothetical protein [Planctomycetota bacterium]
LPRWPEALARAAAGDVTARRSLAAAAAESGHALLLQTAAPLLMDEDGEVRADAWSAFLKHRSSLVEGYDPKADAAARAPIVAALIAALR